MYYQKIFFLDFRLELTVRVDKYIYTTHSIRIEMVTKNMCFKH